MTSEIKNFRIAAAKILAELYSSFPDPISEEDIIGIRKAISDLYEHGRETDDPDYSKFDYQKVIPSTLSFMIREGIVLPTGDAVFRQLVLTSKGLNAVKRVNKRTWKHLWIKQDFDQYVQNAFEKGWVQKLIDIGAKITAGGSG